MPVNNKPVTNDKPAAVITITGDQYTIKGTLGKGELSTSKKTLLADTSHGFMVVMGNGVTSGIPFSFSFNITKPLK